MERQSGILVGMTGPTGAGKSLVASLLESLGYPVIDADIVARQVVNKGSKCLLDLAVEFGIEILKADGTLNRKQLGNIVFADKKKRHKLNRITFPYIQEEIFSQVEKLREGDVKLIFLDAPTLIESGTHKQCDLVVSVIAPAEERLYRIIERDKLTHKEAEARMGAQHDDEYYTSRSDYVVDNQGDMNDLRDQVMELVRMMLADIEEQSI